MIDKDIEYMKKALELAHESFNDLEVPVGAVIANENGIVSFGRNRREKSHNALAHAEIEAIDSACKKLRRWRLTGCTLYVTLEPCPMCMGALINARIDRVVFGAYDLKAGACGSVLNLTEFPLNHKPQICKGVLSDECSVILSDFFKHLRELKK